MTATTVRHISAKSLILATLAAMGLLAALLVSAQTASAQYPNPQYAGPGNFCIDDAGYPGGANCTANDTRISKISPTITEACLTANDTATAVFTTYLVIGASTRYDLGIYIASGQAGTGNAEVGSACYKDVLQPVAALNAAGNPLNPAGTGPFKNEDGDFCGEANQGDPLATSNPGGAIYKLQQAVTIYCNDADNNGVVDPISTCLSWANNENQYTCNGVTALVPGPGTTSKCNCQLVAPEPPILLYKGIDGGDLPDTYGTLFSSNGARHAIQDPTGTGSPKTQGGQVAIWLGSTVDYAWANPTDETTAGGFPSPDALGDDANNTDDEDGVAFLAPWYVGVNGGKIRVSVNASGAGECTAGNDCTVAFWLDWDNSGSFDNNLFSSGGERYQFTLTGGTGASYDLVFNTPATWSGGQLAARVRLYDNSSATPISPLGLVTNGEVEDYINPFGTLGVTLSSFSAACEAQTPTISWASVSEFDTQGYNLLRGLSATGWDTQLNTALIPAQHPGSVQGGSYQWQDTTAQSDVEYYYWLQDVSLGGVTSLHGPVSVTCMAPTAVGLSSLDAEGPAAGSLTWWAVALSLVVLVGGLTVWQQRLKTR